MAKFLVCTLSILLWSACASSTLWSQTTITAQGCDPTSVQNAINTATEGQTVYIPGGTCTWTSGVTVSGKGINIVGAGTSRVIAVFSTATALTLGAQTLTETVTGTDPGYPTPNITVGQTLELIELGDDSNTMTGTVTAWNSGTLSLTLNITTSTGTCGQPAGYGSNCKRWIITTVPATTTTIINSDPGSLSGSPLFDITEDTSFHTSLSNFQVMPGTTNDNVVIVRYATGGQAVLIHDCRMDSNGNNPQPPSGSSTMIMFFDNKGVVWNCSFKVSPFNISTQGAIGVVDSVNNTGGWSKPSLMGNLDTTGQYKVYVEDNDFEAMNDSTATDNNGMMAARYNLFNNSGFATHGADSSDWGQRYIEVYNNRMIFNGYNDGTTFNFQDYVLLRGGTLLVNNNTMDAITSTDYGTKPDVLLSIYNLQANETTGPDPCWGAGVSPASGQYYHAPRQPGFGYVTGTGTTSYTGVSPNPVYTVNGSNDSIGYVGDSEPVYMWGNSRATLNVATHDYGGTACTNPDTSANYIVANRDYYNGTAKSGWAPYTWPHPLRSNATVSVTAPAPPGNLTSAAN